MTVGLQLPQLLILFLIEEGRLQMLCYCCGSNTKTNVFTSFLTGKTCPQNSQPTPGRCHFFPFLVLKPLFFPPVSALLPVFHFCKYSHGKADENKKRFYGICFCFINKSIAPSGWLVFQRGFKQLKRVSSPSFTAVYLVCIKTR